MRELKLCACVRAGVHMRVFSTQPVNISYHLSPLSHN